MDDCILLEITRKLKANYEMFDSYINKCHLSFVTNLQYTFLYFIFKFKIY